MEMLSIPFGEQDLELDRVWEELHSAILPGPMDGLL